MSAIRNGGRARRMRTVVAVLAALFAALAVGCSTRAPAPTNPGLGMQISQSVG